MCYIDLDGFLVAVIKGSSANNEVRGKCAKHLEKKSNNILALCLYTFRQHLTGSDSENYTAGLRGKRG